MALGGAGFEGKGSVKLFAGRLVVGMLLISLAFFVLLWRLYSLQILRGDELTHKGRRNYVQQVEIKHDRGIIYDRYGTILVDNRPSLNVQVIPHFLGDDPARTLFELAELIDMPPADLDAITATVTEKSGLERFRPVLVGRDLSPTQVEAVEAQKSIYQLDGVDIVEGRRRSYPYGSLAAHLLGYVNEIDPERLAREKNRDCPEGDSCTKNPFRYQRGDLIGRSGIEHRYEQRLRGVDGSAQVVVDAKGRRLRAGYVESLLNDDANVAPEPGRNVFLTLDAELQKRAEAAFDGQAGAVIAIDPRDGAVLAMMSAPAYDPNLVSGALEVEEKARLDAHPLKPWVNRAIQGQYAPGSTFKIVTALAALREKGTSKVEKIRCPGYYRMGNHTWRCWRDAGHGHVKLKAALKVSCDTYFYTMAGRIGIDPIAAMGRELGFGRLTGIELPREKPGLMPDEAFHDRVDAATGGYQRGMSVNTAIGQGSVLATPLQLAIAYAAIANRGRVVVPKLVDRVETADFRVVSLALDEHGLDESVTGQGPEVLRSLESEVRHELEVEPGWIEVVHKGLTAVTQEAGGTAYYRRSRLVTMAGKTGTAQVIRLGKDRLDTNEIPYEERDHAWFVAYAPVEDPEIVVAVLNEHSGHGSSHAAPIAREVIDAHFELKNRGMAQLDGSPGAAP